MYIITTWAYIKLWGQTIDINTFYIQYKLANVLIYTLTKVIQSVRNKFSTLNRFKLSTDK